MTKFFKIFSPTYLIAALLLSCQSSKYEVKHRDKSLVPEKFVSEEKSIIPFNNQWWKSFNDTQLNEYMDTTFNDNLDLAEAWARLRQARAELGLSQVDQKLTLDGFADAEGKKQKANINDKRQTFGSEEYALGLRASYEVDLWGRIEDQVEASRLDLAAYEFDIQSTAMFLSAEVAQTWIECKAKWAEIKLVNKQIETNQNTLKLLEKRQRSGLSNMVDIFQQRQQVARLNTLIPLLYEEMRVLELKLLLLGGKNIDVEVQFKDFDLPTLAPMPNIGIPAQVLEQRPDVQASWMRLQASEYKIASTEKTRLPRLTLGSSAAFGADKFTEVFDNWSSSIFAGLTAPILDGDRIDNEVYLAQAKSDELYLNYRQTVLEALNEVETNLNREKWRKENLQALAIEVAYSKNTLDETSRRYRRGLSDYIPVLAALSTYQESERKLIDAQARLLTNRIQLYRSLGGSWDLTENTNLLPHAHGESK